MNFSAEQRDRRFLRLLFLAALLIRLAFVWQIRDLPTQRWLVMDAERYDQLARSIAAGELLPAEGFSQAPLYPYFLSAVYSLTGGGEETSHLVVRLLQAVLDACTVVMLALLAGRLFGRVAGRATGMLAALYGPMIFYVPLLLKSTLTLAGLAAALLLLLVPEGGSRPRRALSAGAAGVLLGVVSLLQENLLLLLPAAGLWVLRFGGAPTWRLRSRVLAALLVGAGLGLAPAPIVNWLADGSLLLTSSQGGMNFYIGNAQGASGTYAGLSAGSHDPLSQKGDARQMAAGFASRERGRTVAAESLAPGDVSTLFWRETWRQIRAEPASWGRLLLRKLRLFWNAAEIPDAEGYDVYRQHGGQLARLWLGFGLVAPLGLAGLTLGRDRPGPRLLIVLTGTLCLAVVAFFVFGRYRLPVVVLLLPAAGHAIAVAIDAVRERDGRRLALAAAMVVGAGLLVNLPAWSAVTRAQFDKAIWFNLGAAGLTGAEEASREALLSEAVARSVRAADDLGRALAIDPSFEVARFERAVAFYRQGTYRASDGDWEAAIAAFDQARLELADSDGSEDTELASRARDLTTTLDAATTQALVNLGAREIEAGRLAAAEAALRRAVAVDPGSAQAFGNLGLCLLRQGQSPLSREAFTRALELAGSSATTEPTAEVAFYRRGLALAGGTDEAGKIR